MHKNTLNQPYQGIQTERRKIVFVGLMNSFRSALRKELILAYSTISLAFMSLGQTISIGSPVSATEGTLEKVSFVVSLDNGAVNTTGSGIFGLVQYSGTATSSDFAGLPPSLFNIPDGQSTDTLVVNIDNDGCLETDETVIATISNPTVGTVNNATSTATIYDDESLNGEIVIEFGANGAENGSNFGFYVLFVPPYINCSGGPITGTLTYTGTATEGVDYVSDSTFNIPEFASYVYVSLPVIDDAEFECYENVIVSISNPSISSISLTDTSAIMIIDDDECIGGVDDVFDFGLSIHPNPVTNYLSFEAEQQMSSYSIVDLNGRKMHSQRIDSKEFQTSTEFLSTGSYLLEIQFENGSRISRKILKE